MDGPTAVNFHNPGGMICNGPVCNSFFTSFLIRQSYLRLLLSIGVQSREVVHSMIKLSVLKCQLTAAIVGCMKAEDKAVRVRILPPTQVLGLTNFLPPGLCTFWNLSNKTETEQKGRNQECCLNEFSHVDRCPWGWELRYR